MIKTAIKHYIVDACINNIFNTDSSQGPCYLILVKDVSNGIILETYLGSYRYEPTKEIENVTCSTQHSTLELDIKGYIKGTGCYIDTEYSVYDRHVVSKVYYMMNDVAEEEVFTDEVIVVEQVNVNVNNESEVKLFLQNYFKLDSFNVVKDEDYDGFDYEMGDID